MKFPVITPRFALVVVAVLLSALVGHAQPDPQVVFLWQNGAPGFESRKNEPEQAAD